MSQVLIPFDRREAISLRTAAKTADRSESTVRIWCQEKGIGRKVAGDVWFVSRVALAMFDNDIRALNAYKGGDRSSPLVTAYYDRLGLSDLLREWSLTPQNAQSPQTASVSGFS